MINLLTGVFVLPVGKRRLAGLEHGLRSPAAPRYQHLRNNRRARRYDFKKFEAMNVTKSYRFIMSGDLHGPRPSEFIRPRAAITSHKTEWSPYGGFFTWTLHRVSRRTRWQRSLGHENRPKIGSSWVDGLGALGPGIPRRGRAANRPILCGPLGLARGS